MKGGYYGLKGYILQAVAALLECLDDQEWTEIKLEPGTKEDKADFILYRESKAVCSVQVKSSILPFGKKAVEDWLLILPGNHDFYTGSEKLWKDFQNRASSSGNIILLNEYRTYRFGLGDDELVIYPAYCDSKHSKTNRLKWIAEKFEKSAAFNIGIAHGTIKGISPDLKEEYFPMELMELNTIPMDCWLIGHTHITYPFDLPYDQDLSGYSIINAGTHEQLDKNNNTEGNAFIVTLDRKFDIKNIYIRKVRTGNILHKDISFTAEAGDVRTLEQILTSITKGLPKQTRKTTNCW